MGLLDGKSWQAQDLYNEYLELKEDISGRVIELEYLKNHSTVTEKGIKIKEDILEEKVTRLKVTLNHLKLLHGVAMEDLILLSIGIDV